MSLNFCVMGRNIHNEIIFLRVAREGVCCDLGAAACAVGEPSVSTPRRVPGTEEASGGAAG